MVSLECIAWHIRTMLECRLKEDGCKVNTTIEHDRYVVVTLPETKQRFDIAVYEMTETIGVK